MFYLDLFAALNRHQVSYVLIGGLAAPDSGLPAVTNAFGWVVKNLQISGITSGSRAMLAELVTSPNVPISRERLLSVSHERSESLLARTVDVAVMRLRKRVEPDPAQPRYIQTVWGVGYVFVPDGAPG